MVYISIVLFLVASTWWVELGGINEGQLEYLNSTLYKNQSDIKLDNFEYLGRRVIRFSVDIPKSDNAPPLAAVTPLLSTFSSMGYSVLSHNDEYKSSKDMVYLTWMLHKEIGETSGSMEKEKEL